MYAELQISKLMPTSGPISLATSSMSFAVGRNVNGTFSRMISTPEPLA